MICFGQLEQQDGGLGPRKYKSIHNTSCRKEAAQVSRGITGYRSVSTQVGLHSSQGLHTQRVWWRTILLAITIRRNFSPPPIILRNTCQWIIICLNLTHDLWAIDRGSINFFQGQIKEKLLLYVNKRVIHRIHTSTLWRKQKTYLTNTASLLEVDFPSQKIPKKEAEAEKGAGVGSGERLFP